MIMRNLQIAMNTTNLFDEHLLLVKNEFPQLLLLSLYLFYSKI